MGAEAWPTEAAATAAVDAAARKAWDDVRGALTPSLSRTEFDDLPVERRLEIRNGVLGMVWAALEALPDPRHAAWQQGHDTAYDIHPGNPAATNPYPSGL